MVARLGRNTFMGWETCSLVPGGMGQILPVLPSVLDRRTLPFLLFLRIHPRSLALTWSPFVSSCQQLTSFPEMHRDVF